MDPLGPLPPPITTNPPPSDVWVQNWPSPGQGFYNTLKREYRQLQRSEQEGQVTVMRYHSPGGDVIHVFDVFLHKPSDTVILHGADGTHPCVVVAQVQSAQVIMKIIPAPEEEEARKPIGFEVRN
jgi:hypothetical protein